MKEKGLTIYVSIISIVGFILQLTRISNNLKTIILVVSLLSLFILLIFSLLNTDTINRKKLVKRANKIILNTKEKLVLFGGDMSWVDDYIESINKINKEHKVIEVFFPETKYINCDNDTLMGRIIKLRKAGANVYSYKTDYGLRCIMLDPDSYNSNDYMEIMITDRIFRNSIDPFKNKYVYKHLRYIDRVHKNICKSYISNYAYIKENSTKY